MTEGVLRDLLERCSAEHPDAWEDFDTDAALLSSRSPLFSAGSIKAPVLVVHGASDLRVPRLQSGVMVSALRERKQKPLYMVLPDDGHGFLNPANRLRAALVTESFLASVLGGRVEAPPPREDLQPFMR